MDRPRPYRAADGSWQDPVNNFSAPRDISHGKARLKRKGYSRRSRHFRALSLFYRHIEKELENG